jgi:phage baseplate assembly protein W
MSEWVLLNDPITPQLSVVDPDDPGADQFADLSFIGRTMLRPVSREFKIDWSNGTGNQLVASAVGQILGTRSDSPAGVGELPWRTEFGSQLYRLRNKLNSAILVEQARQYVIDALRTWAPWVRVTNVRLVRTGTTANNLNTLAIRVQYQLVSLTDSNNQITTPGLETDVLLG